MANTLFCPIPANFNGNTYHTSKVAANRISTVTDRRLDTSRAAGVFVLDLTSNTKITHLFIKAKNLDGNITITGITNTITQAVDTYTVRDAQGNTVKFNPDGFDNYLISFPDGTTTSTLTVTVSTGTVYEIAALDAQVKIDAEKYLLECDFSRVHRAATIHESITGRLKAIPPVNSEPYRWQVALGLLYLNIHEETARDEYNKILDFLTNNPNFAFVPEYTRYPDRVFTAAVLPNFEYQLRYIEETIKIYQGLHFRIAEA